MRAMAAQIAGMVRFYRLREAARAYRLGARCQRW